MSLLAIIVGLLIERFYENIEELKKFGWFESFNTWLSDRFKGQGFMDSPVGVLAVLLPVVIGVAVVQALLAELLGLLAFLFAIAVLVYCLGPRNLSRQVTVYINARNNDDEEGAREAAAMILGEEAPQAVDAMDRRITEAVLCQINERVLAVIFWFFILGPIGAVLYRLSNMLAKDTHAVERFGSSFIDAAVRLHAILAWLPARLTGWGYALMGDFAAARHNWQVRSFDWIDDWVSSNKGILIASGTGALGLEIEPHAEEQQDHAFSVEAIRYAMELAGRATVVWVVVIALLTLAGWSVM